jgi:gas vesicle protein
MSEQESNQTGTILLAFVAGAALGAGLSLLLTPKSGEEMRGVIKDLTGDALDKIKDFAAETQEKIKEAVEEGKEKFLEKKSVLSSAIEAGKEAMAAERDKQKP